MSQGVNIPDIDRVVQWKLPATFSNFIQRAGRAARGRGCNGLAVLLVEKPAYNVDLVTDSASTSRGKKKKKKHEDEAAKLTKLTPEQKAERSEYARVRSRWTTCLMGTHLGLTLRAQTRASLRLYRAQHAAERYGLRPSKAR